MFVYMKDWRNGNLPPAGHITRKWWLTTHRSNPERSDWVQGTVIEFTIAMVLCVVSLAVWALAGAADWNAQLIQKVLLVCTFGAVFYGIVCMLFGSAPDSKFGSGKEFRRLFFKAALILRMTPEALALEPCAERLAYSHLQNLIGEFLRLQSLIPFDSQVEAARWSILEAYSVFSELGLVEGNLWYLLRRHPSWPRC